MAHLWSAHQARVALRSFLVVGIILSSSLAAQPTNTKAQVALPATPQYTVTELSPLTGDTAAFLRGINSSGVAVGWSQTSTRAHAVVWQAGVPSPLGELPSATFSEGFAINTGGQVAGLVGTADPVSGGIGHAVRWDNGVPTDLDSGANADAINVSAQVVGFANTADSIVLWSGGQRTILGKLPNQNGVQLISPGGVGINDAGQVAGTVLVLGFPRAARWDNGIPTELPGLAAGDNTFAVAINGIGVVIGRDETPNGTLVPVIWRNGIPAALPNLPGTISNDIRVVAAINDADQIVGTSQDHAVLWQGGTVFDLNDAIPTGSGWVLQEATGINATGQIVGNGVHNGQQSRGFLLTPIASASADLSISLTASPNPVPVGSNLTYTLVVANAGPSSATGVTVTDTLASALTFVLATPSQGTCSGTTTVSCSLGTLVNGASATVNVNERPVSAGTVTNTASVIAAEPDLNIANNTVTVATVVRKKPRLNYFALGDSIASGHGLLDDGTTCRRSQRAYPYKLRDLVAERYDLVNFPADHFLACSGATAANPGTISDTNLWINNQIDYVLGHLSTDPTLVTITIGADDLHFASPRNFVQHMFLQDSLNFFRWLDKRTSGVSASLRPNVTRLLAHDNIAVVLTDYHNPTNMSSVLFAASPTLGGSCIDILLVLTDCYDRTETAVHGLNSAIVLDVYAQLGRPPRLGVASLHAAFHGHESPQLACGGSPPAIADTWVQYIGDPNSNALITGWLRKFTGVSSGDCIHINETGAAKFAATINERAIALGS